MGLGFSRKRFAKLAAEVKDPVLTDDLKEIIEDAADGVLKDKNKAKAKKIVKKDKK